jgi:hypothetical protein
MKKLIVLAMITAVMVLVAALVHAQGPPNDLKPTFISPTPGLYVNGWPAFTVSYPKEWEWVEGPAVAPAIVFQAKATRPDLPPLYIAIGVTANDLPLEDWAKMIMPFYIEFATDVKVLYDKPSQLKDGTPAREIEVEYVMKDVRKQNNFTFMTKKDTVWVTISLADYQGRIGADVKRIAYSLTFQPDREKPVKVPPDVRAFFDMYCVDLLGQDVKVIMEHYSDRFRSSGMTKAYVERFFRNDPLSTTHKDIISEEATVTVFEAQGDKAYVDGFYLEKVKGDATAVKMPMIFQQIINEHGEWRWFGNQK